MSATLSIGTRALLLASAAVLPVGSAFAQDQAAPPADDNNEELVVTGQTTRNRPLITASADITYANRADIDRKAPRSTADMLELVPGIFVEGTAGQISNNY